MLRRLPRPAQRARVASVLQREIAAVLETDASLIQPDQSLAYLGLDSLRAAMLQTQLSRQWQIVVPMEALAFADTIDGLAELFVQVVNGEREMAGSHGPPHAHLIATVAADLVLDSTPAAHMTVDARQITHPRRLLLTGATGYVGAFLLRDLLLHTAATVHCLVRTPDTSSAERRVTENLQRFGLWSDAWGPRVIAEAGDLALPQFGWSKARYRELATQVDGIHHNGAAVHLLWSYDKLRGPNVLGTRSVLGFAACERLKPVFFVSTAGLFDTPEVTGVERLDEATLPRDVSRLPNGYTQSKWVGERLALLARDAGIPVTVFRVGPVLADGGGAVHLDDLMARVFLASLDLGVAPAPTRPVDLVPVEYVSRAIVALASRVASRDRTFHIVNPSPLTSGELQALLQQLPRPVHLVPLEQWLAVAMPAILSNPQHPLFPALDLLRATSGDPQQAAGLLEQALSRPPLDCRQTCDALAGTGIVCPPAHARLRETLLRVRPA